LLELEPAAGAEGAELDPEVDEELDLEPDAELAALASLLDEAFVSDFTSVFESGFVFLSALSPDAAASPLDDPADEPLFGA
jgi:hypothetical protein